MTSTPPDDDDEVRPDDLLYRRFFPKKGRIRPTAYTLPRSETPDPELSVELARLTTPEEVLRDQPAGMKIGVLRVRDVVEKLHLRVRRDDQGGPAHCIIEGVDSMDLCDQLADLTTLYRPPSADT
jgi:hypothetical protein